MYIKKFLFPALLLVSLLIIGCQSPRMLNVKLSASSKVDPTTGLRLLSVDTNGTAQIEFRAIGEVISSRPNTATNCVSWWTLDSADPATQSVKLSRPRYPRRDWRCWPFDPINLVEGEERQFTPEQLTQIARHCAASEDITTVDCTHYPLLYVFTKGNTLARAQWGGGIGQLCLTVDIDRRGEVIQHWVSVVVCGGGGGPMFISAASTNEGPTSRSSQ